MKKKKKKKSSTNQNDGQNFYVRNSTKLTSEAMRERWRQTDRQREVL
jgi:hypothetical protein